MENECKKLAELYGKAMNSSDISYKVENNTCIINVKVIGGEITFRYTDINEIKREIENLSKL